MGDKRETRTDLPKREFDADLNDKTFSNKEDPPIDQRDSDHLRDHIGHPSDPTPLDELQGDGTTRMSMTSATLTTCRDSSNPAAGTPACRH